jgi:hypothetical protein
VTFAPEAPTDIIAPLPTITYKEKTTKTRRRRSKPPSPSPASTLPSPHRHNTRYRGRRTPRCAAVPGPIAQSAIADSQPIPTTPPSNNAPTPCPHLPKLFANSVIHPQTGASQEYPALRDGPDGAAWTLACAREIGRLAQGIDPSTDTGTDTFTFVPHNSIPSDRTATYLRIVVAEKPHKTEKQRVRFTCGGNLIHYPGIVSTLTADLTTATFLFNSVVSTPSAKFLTADIKDFYLNSPMERPEYMRIPLSVIPESIMTNYNLQTLAHNGHVLVKITKGMYGLPQAGHIAYDLLVKCLALSDYSPCTHTPGLWKHATRDIIFCLVVDDFGIKYSNIEDANHLLKSIQSYYTYTTDWSGTLYCGLTLKWDYRQRTVDPSMPTYIEKALFKFQHTSPTKNQDSPHSWNQPVYGARTQLTNAPDTSLPLDKAGTKRLQEVVGPSFSMHAP